MCHLFCWSAPINVLMIKTSLFPRVLYISNLSHTNIRTWYLYNRLITQFSLESNKPGEDSVINVFWSILYSNVFTSATSEEIKHTDAWRDLKPRNKPRLRPHEGSGLQLQTKLLPSLKSNHVKSHSSSVRLHVKDRRRHMLDRVIKPSGLRLVWQMTPPIYPANQTPCSTQYIELTNEQLRGSSYNHQYRT